MPSGLAGLLPAVKTMTWRLLGSGAAAPGVVVAASARGWCVSGRGGSWDPVARVRSASAGVVDSGRRSVVAGGRTSPGEILAPVFTGAGDGGARGCRDLSWKRRRGGAPPPPHGLGSGGKPQIRRIGRWRRLRVFFLLGGIVSEPATTERLEDDGIFAVDGGIFAAWFAEAGRWFLFGNEDGVERSLGRGVVFGSRFFPAQVLHISLVSLVVKVGAVGCLRVWSSVGMCRRGFCSMSVARLAGGAHVMWVVLYRF
jgi:hypothetical protein